MTRYGSTLPCWLYRKMPGLWVLAFLPGLACAQEEETSADPTVKALFSGMLTVNPEVDPTPDYRGFEVLVAVDRGGEPDTLGFAVTDSAGAFSMDIVAPQRGIYALIISRRGQILKVDEMAIAEADTASLRAQFPVGQRRLRVRSQENAAWMAYQNARAQHSQSILDLVRSGEYTNEGAGRHVELSSSLLWNMQGTFPGTMGAEMSAAESVLMIAGWSDSLVVARAEDIPSDNVRYAEIVRAVRQSTARLEGQEEAIAYLEETVGSLEQEELRAEVHAEFVAAHMDSLNFDEARNVAQLMQTTYSGTLWATWAANALYELEYLMPGMPAPSFAVRTTTGDSVRLADLRGKPVVLEFYQPRDAVYQREFGGRNSLLTETDGIHVVSVSLEPDSLLNDALFDEREPRGIFVYAASGYQAEIARSYNVNYLPVRFLIGSDGKLVAKYEGGAMAVLRERALSLASDL